MPIPRCYKKYGECCPLHSSGKFIKWSCGEKYDPKIRHSAFISNKHKCHTCNHLVSSASKMCSKCNGKMLGEKRRGMKLPEAWCKAISLGQKGDKAKNWKGSNVTYNGLHSWFRKTHGNPGKCEACGKLGSRPNGKWTICWANKSGQYLRDKSDWIGLCGQCHKRQEPSEKKFYWDREKSEMVLS